MECYFAINKRKEILLFVTIWMKRKDITLSDVNRTEKDKTEGYH